MDEVCLAVLDRVGAVGAYRIISEDEFFEVFPENAEKSRAELARALKSLVSDGYVDVKYSSGSMYCVSALKNAPDPVICPDEYDSESRPEVVTVRVFPAFLAAFLGGAAGSLLISLIFAFI